MTDPPRPDRPGGGAPRPDGRARTSRRRSTPFPRRGRLFELARAQAPLLTVLGVVALSMFWVGLQHWRQGTTGLGLALLIGAGLRARLSDAEAGLLAVRQRRVDIAWYAALGVIVILVALTIVGGPVGAA